MEIVELGDKVKDRITGFIGIATGITTWMYGCRQITVRPLDLKDGRPQDSVGFDEPQLEIVQKRAVEAHPAKPAERLQSPGGDIKAIPSTKK